MEAWERKLLERQAQLCRVLADPSRLELLYHLGASEHTVGELVARTGLRQANVSQHLALLRERGVVRTRRVGTAIYYSLADPDILEACRLTRKILLRQLEATSELIGQATAG